MHLHEIPQEISILYEEGIQLESLILLEFINQKLDHLERMMDNSVTPVVLLSRAMVLSMSRIVIIIESKNSHHLGHLYGNWAVPHLDQVVDSLVIQRVSRSDLMDISMW